jgi:hypothetical protein
MATRSANQAAQRGPWQTAPCCRSDLPRCFRRTQSIDAYRAARPRRSASSPTRSPTPCALRTVPSTRSMAYALLRPFALPATQRHVVGRVHRLCGCAGFPPASMAALCGAECVGAAGCARASARVWLGCNRCVAVQQCSLRPARRPPIPVRGRSRSGPSRCMQRSRSLGVSSS